MKADLHVHSTASDGVLSPSEVVRRAAQRGVQVLAIADHDSVDGIAEASEAAADEGITLIPAVELSSSDNGRDIHVLGYFVDCDDSRLRSLLADLRAARRRRAEHMVAELSKAGYEVSFDDVLAMTGEGAIGRSHVARALVSAGHAESVREAFQALIGRGGPFYVPKEARTPQEVIAAIRDAGGVAVVAHPGVNKADDLLPAMVTMGLAGIEAYHADHDECEQERYAALARELGLLCTGGTDFHGPTAPNPDIGDIDVPEECVRSLLAVRPGLAG